ncbi:hypothetical protein LZ30DRAFT_586882 [Colletotrichum cereale]|nr:hypothetical protein LZ30DRAFT_586882 [Colletotrichum cereale]
MAPKRVAAGRKLEGAQAVVKVEKGDADAEHKKNEDREIDDFLDYVEIKLEDLELEGKKVEVLAAAPKAEEGKKKKKGAGVPKAKKKRAKAAKTKNNSEAAKVKPEATAPETETSVAPKPKGAAAPKAKEGKRAKAEEDFSSKWDEYFGKRELADWQRLCRDLGLPDDLPSKTQCRKVSQHPPPPARSYRKTRELTVPRYIGPGGGPREHQAVP